MNRTAKELPSEAGSCKGNERHCTELQRRGGATKCKGNAEHRSEPNGKGRAWISKEKAEQGADEQRNGQARRRFAEELQGGELTRGTDVPQPGVTYARGCGVFSDRSFF